VVTFPYMLWVFDPAPSSSPPSSPRDPPPARPVPSSPVNRRPKLSIVAPNVSPDEAAAVIAAVERFIRETAPVRVAPAAAPNPWHAAALREGVARQPVEPLPWV
jgi:hypothetical protein